MLTTTPATTYPDGCIVRYCYLCEHPSSGILATVRHYRAEDPDSLGIDRVDADDYIGLRHQLGMRRVVSSQILFTDTETRIIWPFVSDLYVRAGTGITGTNLGDSLPPQCVTDTLLICGDDVGDRRGKVRIPCTGETFLGPSGHLADSYYNAVEFFYGDTITNPVAWSPYGDSRSLRPVVWSRLYENAAVVTAFKVVRGIRTCRRRSPLWHSRQD